MKKKNMAENYMCKSAAAKGISMAAVAVSFLSEPDGILTLKEL